MADGYNPREVEVISVTIANGEQDSTVANSGGKRLCGIEMPAAWTSGTVQLYMTPTGLVADKKVIKDAVSSSTLVLTVAAGEFYQVPPWYVYGIRNMVLRSSVAQGAARVIKLHFREV